MRLRLVPFEYETSETLGLLTPLKDVPPGPERQLRLDLRILLNQNDGTFTTSHAIADDIAVLLLRNLRSAGYLKDGL